MLSRKLGLMKMIGYAPPFMLKTLSSDEIEPNCFQKLAARPAEAKKL